MKDDNTPVRSGDSQKRSNARIRQNIMQPGCTSRATIAATIKKSIKSIPRHKKMKRTFAHRQKEKRWLPSHIWHAKRAEMSQLWGFMIPLRPTLKCYRKTHRMITGRGAMGWDSSHIGTLVIKGNERCIKRALQPLLAPADIVITGRGMCQGKRMISTWLFEENKWPEAPVAPVDMFWCPSQDSDHEDSATNVRQLVLRVHPSAFSDIWGLLVSLCQRQKPVCEIKDLRKEIGSIDVTGISCFDNLQEILGCGLMEASLVAQNCHTGSILSLNLQDPRLQAKASDNSATAEKYNQHDSVQPFKLFNDDQRNQSIKDRSRKSHLRADKVSSTGDLNKEVKQPRIPSIVAFSHTVSSVDLAPESNVAKDNIRITLMLPWQWVLPFWCKLMRTPGMTFGGIKQMEQISFELGQGLFPRDYVGTPTGKIEFSKTEHLECGRLRKRTTRKDKGSNSSLPGHDCSGKTCQASSILKSISDSACKTATSLPSDVNPDGDSTNAASLSNINPVGKLWHIVPSLLKTFLLSHTSQLPVNIKSAIFTVRIQAQTRGIVKDNAVLYRIPSEILRKLQNRDTSESTDHLNHIISTRRVPKENDKDASVTQQEVSLTSDAVLIGCVTRGEFNMSQGCISAFGILSFVKAFYFDTPQKRQRQRHTIKMSGWCVVQNPGESIGRLASWHAIP